MILDNIHVTAHDIFVDNCNGITHSHRYDFSKVIHLVNIRLYTFFIQRIRNVHYIPSQ